MQKDCGKCVYVRVAKCKQEMAKKANVKLFKFLFVKY